MQILSSSRFLCVLLLWLSLTDVFSAELMVARWRTFTHREWLGPRAPIMVLHEDRQGRLWAGTSGAGLLCYDGIGWRRFTPANSGFSHSGVLSIAETPDGTLWFGTGLSGTEEGKGICAYTPQGQWKRLDNILPDRKLGAVTALLYSQDGKLWVGTLRSGVYTYDPKSRRWTPVDSLSAGDGISWSVTALIETSRGIWVATTGPTKLFPSPERGQTFTRPDSVSAMGVDRGGKLWLASRYGDLYRWTPGRSRPTRQSGEMLSRIAEGEGGYLTIHPDRSGRLWVASERGVAVYDIEGESWQAWWTTQNSGLPSDRVHAILEKKDGTLWFGTDRGIAVCDFRPGGWQRFVKGQGILINESVSAIYRRQDGTLLFAGDQGVDTYDPKLNRWQSFIPDVPGWNASIRHIVETDGGTVWFISPFQLFSWDHRRWRAFGLGPSGLTEASRSDIVQQALGVAWARVVSGKLWLGAQTGGIFSYAPRTHEWDRLPLSDAKELSSAYLLDALQTKDGSWWMAAVLPGQTQAILRYDSSAKRWQTFTRKSISADLSPDSVREGPWMPTAPIHEASDGTLWFGSQSGLARYSRGRWQFVPLNSGGEEEAGEVRSIAADSQGRIWAGTQKGVVILHEGHTQWLSEEDGLAGDETQSVLVADGVVWIASSGGISRFLAESIAPETFLVNGRGDVLSSRSLAVRSYRDSGEGGIPTILNRLRLWPVRGGEVAPVRVERTFAMRCFAFNPWQAESPDGLWFSWQVDDGSWSPETKSLAHTFRDVPPGAHKIRVRARNRWLNEDSSPAECRVIVESTDGIPWVWAGLGLSGWAAASYLWYLRRRGQGIASGND